MAHGFNIIGFNVDLDGKCTADGGFVGNVLISLGETLSVPAGSYLTTSASSVVTFSGEEVIMDSIPTSDPSVSGQLWNDSGTLKVSA